MNNQFKNSTLVKKDIVNQNYDQYSFHRSDIHNCTFSNTNFTACDFSRSNFMCLRFDKCIFMECDFRNIDLTTCKLSNCNFEKCDFMLSEIADNYFYKCTFNLGNFTGATLKDNAFNMCSFLQIDLNGSITSLNYFRECDISDSIFGNCTIDYNIMTGCKLADSRINIETLGTTFGLTLQELERVTFLSLGNELPDSPETFSKIRDCFEKENDCIGLFVYDISFAHKPLIEAVDTLISGIQIKNNNQEFIPSNGFTFLFRVFQELYKQQQLPFIALARFCTFISDTLRRVSMEDIFYEKYILFYNNLTLLRSAMLSDFSELHGSSDPKEMVTIKMTFHVKPTVEIAKVLDEMHIYIFGEAPYQPTECFRVCTGSYVEVLHMSITTLFALNLSLFLLIGCVKKLIVLRANTKLLLSPKLPKKYYLEATKLDKEHGMSPQIVNLIISHIMKSVPDSLKNIEEAGFSSENLEEVKEEDTL